MSGRVEPIEVAEEHQDDYRSTQVDPLFKEKINYAEKAKDYVQKAKDYDYKKAVKTYKWASMNSVVAVLCVCMFFVIIALGVQRGDIGDIQKYVEECVVTRNVFNEGVLTEF